MAQRAGLEERFLAVKRRRTRCAPGFPVGCGIRVTLQAEQIDVAHAQHVDIRAAVRKMARGAALDFHGFVFEDKRSLLVGVTGETDGVLC